MVSRLNFVSWTVLGFGLLACGTKQGDKFNLNHPHKDRQLIVTVDPTLRVESLRNVLGREPSVERLNGTSVLLTFPGNVNLAEKAKEIAEQNGVNSVEANLIYHLSDVTPNDPDFGRLFGLKNIGQSGGTAGADIGATRAWDVTTGSENVIVGVIDSGVDYNHPDLKDNIWANPGETGLDAEGKDKATNGVDDDNNGFVDDARGWDFYNNDNNPMDDNSHGTHVAGTIGARGDNGTGVVGVNWKVKIVPIKVFSASGDSSSDVLIRGIEYATKLGVLTATNNSWGGGAFSDAMFAAIKRHGVAGIIFAAAAGNESNNNDANPSYPSTYDLPNIISVASTNRRDDVSSFSNYGAKNVSLAAPGEDIWSTIPGGGYGLKSGTSMATPHVTGAIALIKARFPELTAEKIKQKILSSTTKIAKISHAVKFGRLDVASALEDDSTLPARVVGLELEEKSVNEIRISFAETGDDGEDGKASMYQVRMSDTALTTDEEWEAATIVTLLDSKTENSRVSGRVAGLPFNSKGFLTVRAFDNVGNASLISESLFFELSPVAVLHNEENDKLDNWTVEGTWGSLTEDEKTFLSDSPGKNYSSSANVSATTKDFDFGTTDLVLGLTMRYDFENNYDFGFIEVSSDEGATWVQVAKYTGNAAVGVTSVSLRNVLTANKFRLRFRTTSDFSIEKAGWDIDQVQIIGQEPQQEQR